MAPFAERLASAAAIAAGDRRIVVSDIEARLGTTFTADTLKALQWRYPRTRFVWLMGGDNLSQIPHWQRWTDIFRSVPVAVFDRPTTARRALAGVAAQRFRHARIRADAAHGLAETAPPAWAFFHTRLDPRSATKIRAERDVSPPMVVRPASRRRRSKRIVPADSGELLRRIQQSLEDSKAENIVTLDLAGKTAIADYMVIASGRSARQVTAMTEHLSEALAGHSHLSVEGKAQGDWVLIDAGDVIVHLFRPETRAYYNLEKMWGSAVPDAEAANQ